MPEEHKVRQRERDWFHVDNKFVEEGYMGLSKSITAVYLTLCKHADNTKQTCYHNIETMMANTGLQRNTVRKNLKLLQEYNIIAIDEYQKKHGMGYIYTLLDKSVWKPLKEQGQKMTRSINDPVKNDSATGSKNVQQQGQKMTPNYTNYNKTNNNNTKEMSDKSDLAPAKEKSPKGYPQEFEQLWKSTKGWFGERGSKKEAYEAFKRLNPNRELLEVMIEAIESQKSYKEAKQKIPPDYFAENMPHVCRWIKKERWEDDLPELKYANGKYEPKRITFVDKQAYDKFVNDPENQKKIKSGEVEVKFQKEGYV